MEPVLGRNLPLTHPAESGAACGPPCPLECRPPPSYLPTIPPLTSPRGTPAVSTPADIPRSPAPAERPTSIRHLVLVALLVITAVNYIQRNCISPAATTIEAELNVTGPELDLAAGAFFLAYTIMQVPSGWLAHRRGTRVILSLYAAGWSLALIGCAVARNFTELYAGRLAMGVLQAGIFPCATLILAVWYPASQRGFATASLNSFMLIGGAAGTML